jgi:hypothetical protein
MPSVAAVAVQDGANRMVSALAGAIPARQPCIRLLSERQVIPPPIHTAHARPVAVVEVVLDGARQMGNAQAGGIESLQLRLIT